MAKRKSLFDDKGVEIEELTYIIKQVSDISVVILHMSQFLLISLYWLKLPVGVLVSVFTRIFQLTTILCKSKPLAVIWYMLSVSHQDINSLNKQIAQLQDLVRSRSGQNGRHIQTHSNTIVVSLQVQSYIWYFCSAQIFQTLQEVLSQISLTVDSRGGWSHIDWHEMTWLPHLSFSY